MNEHNNHHFKFIFWFIVFLTSFGMFLTVYLMVRFKGEVAERFADMSMVFWLTTAVGGGIGYLIGSSMNKPVENKITNTSPGKTTAEITANITTEPEEKKEEKPKE
jgi:hypothetical protein